MNSLIPWVGGKSKLLWIINELAPADYTCFADVFGGSGTVTLNHPIRNGCLEVYNDYNSNLTNLMSCVKYKPMELLKELQFLPLHSRDDFEILLRFFQGEDFLEYCMERELELTELLLPQPEAEELKSLMTKRCEAIDVRRAANYFKLIRYSYSSTGKSFGGRSCDLRRFFHLIWECSRRLSSVVVENKDFESLIQQYDRPKTWFYCDPPYYEAESYYAVEFSESDHQRLHDTLSKAKGYAMVSYNNCEFVRELYKDFYIFLTDRPDSLSKEGGKRYEELIMTNYDPHSHGSQLSLNDSAGHTLIHTP
jgi:DNA adenine methylase